MKILLLTDIPPCENYTAGLALEKLVRLLPAEDIVLCSVVNQQLNPVIPDDLCHIPSLFLKKPREAGVRLLPRGGGAATACFFEVLQSVRTSRVLLPAIIDFARINRVEALWVVLQGQTMVRLARPLSRALDVPLFTQVWDPFGWWLRENHVDGWTRHRLLVEFDKVIRHSTACATASWAMSEIYTKKYGGRNVPVIAGLPRELARQPAAQPHPDGDFVIGMAGQFYAQAEWRCLMQTLNQVNWTIAGRKIRIRVLGGRFLSETQSPTNFEYLGWQSQEETIRLLSEADLLYMPYWFSEEFREESSCSFPSKLVTYFASGRPVFCHAPAYASPAKYIKQHEAGYLCESLDSTIVLKCLEFAITDTAYYRKVASNGTYCFMRDFTLERMKESFMRFFNIKSTTQAGFIN